MGFLSTSEVASSDAFKNLQAKLKETGIIRQYVEQHSNDNPLKLAKLLDEKFKELVSVVRTYRKFIGLISNGYENILLKNLGKTNSLANIEHIPLNMTVIKTELHTSLSDIRRELNQSRDNALKTEMLNYIDDFTRFFEATFVQLNKKYETQAHQPMSLTQR